MSSMADKMYIKDLELELLGHRLKNLKIEELMDEILLLDNPEAMREIALFVQELLNGGD